MALFFGVIICGFTGMTSLSHGPDQSDCSEDLLLLGIFGVDLQRRGRLATINNHWQSLATNLTQQ